MPIDITPLSSADLPTLGSLDHDGWLHPYNPQLKHFRPALTSREAAIDWWIAKQTRRLNSPPNPNEFFVKCEDSETGKIMGYAVWVINAGEGEEEVKATWHPEGSVEREFAERFINGLWAFLGERVREKHMDLHALVVSPSHRNRGVARALLNWGTALADTLGIPTIISSLPSARGAYEKCGFGAIEVIPPNPELDDEEMMKTSAKWRELRSEDLSGWLMWRGVGRDWREGDEVPWKV
ncbi:hypothetical protein DM02DRAFT_661525 [Periconia macrospinosa]|uniref:N-acetyltransferase domain-containing protein n=1 Tax=Periconia macrospinosa TaxID=97972 RepID=A0A2V1D740_9PLEO|nr:hypothetical protein DM02DRAFT_661525 [Periconia macrospinosa]